MEHGKIGRSMENHPLEQSYIAEQRSPDVRSLPFGKSTVGDAGCELIACHNALLSLGRFTPFESLRDEVCLHRLLWRRGKWGMRPRQMKKLLFSHGVRARFFFGGYEKLEKTCSPGDMVILTTWNHKWWKNGLHSYFCLRKEEGWLCVNNRQRLLLPSLYEAARGHRLFAALRIER